MAQQYPGFVYCDYKRREAQTLMALISSILEQALRRTCLSSVPEEIKPLYTLHTRKGNNPTLKQISDVFNKLFSQCSNIFIVIEALDECSPTDDLAIEFVHAVQALGNNAEEEKDRSYSYLVDFWSAGVVLYISLFGFPPFSDELYRPEFPRTLSQQIKSGYFDHPSPQWDAMGDPVLDLIDSMLAVDPYKRYWAEDCLKDVWILGDEAKRDGQGS